LEFTSRQSKQLLKKMSASEQVVQNEYQRVFGRAADAEGLAHYVRLLNEGKLDAAELGRVLEQSEEASAKATAAAPDSWTITPFVPFPTGPRGMSMTLTHSTRPLQWCFCTDKIPPLFPPQGQVSFFDIFTEYAISGDVDKEDQDDIRKIVAEAKRRLAAQPVPVSPSADPGFVSNGLRVTIKICLRKLWIEIIIEL
jgi:hypothetical protein